ncbi:DUF998 domain-containing protein [Sinomonas gamaensis]|uniref:DUF998 domain-containing protein n=1 Tax=Sinomonas gamaensis TaxID=2565624 RepID=UPI00110A083E|nr:DUF998 domain-containing protein [Sinomonas gamaensis]
MIGSWAARSMVQYFFVERLVSVAWHHIDHTKKAPNNFIDYDYSWNFVSDLGARGCHILDGGTVYERWVCSPLFAVMNASFMLVGIGVFVAAALISATVLRAGGNLRAQQRPRKRPARFLWTEMSPSVRLVHHLNGEHHGHKLTPHHWLTTIMRLLMALSGIALIFVGGFPEDYNWDIHASSTMIFLVLAIASLACLVMLWWKTRIFPALLILFSAVVAAIGGGLMLVALVFSIQPIDRGLLERLVVYGFIAGMTVMGVTLGSAGRRARRARRETREYRRRSSIPRFGIPKRRV